MATVRLGKKKFHLPGSPLIRQTMGFGLVVGGVFGFLPVLGFWMVPLGVVILSVDNAPVRKVRRKAEVWWGRRRRSRQGAP
ncbi:MAG: hypothetical protein K8R18_07005 [Parvibaculum sp.]|uniref:hypothetical protein n=1 Tax=Parvibaculum sp. TaxID=2024848 RepID=UPI0025E0F6E8|nr:hypothetical protein [Parvibaculum sp.]MCE9649358.1 hypothetical protein [Parvibaculum sp.]